MPEKGFRTSKGEGQLRYCEAGLFPGILSIGDRRTSCSLKGPLMQEFRPLTAADRSFSIFRRKDMLEVLPWIHRCRGKREALEEYQEALRS